MKPINNPETTREISALYHRAMQYPLDLRAEIHRALDDLLKDGIAFTYNGALASFFRAHGFRFKPYYHPILSNGYFIRGAI